VFITPASTNTVIALQGAGGQTNATVTFQVDDASNTGVSGVPVTFTLIPTTGDATLTTATGTTAANGQVSTNVVSGTEHGSVTVHAVISTPSGIKTADSNSLAITTGIPTEGNFSMASKSLTANNADDTQGITDVITVQLSDRFNNPAPDGTAVSFTTKSGQIPGSCLTVGGSCTVTWTSSGLPNPNDVYHSPGRAEILAYTVGEENFTDVDGDGVFDNSDIFTTSTSGVDIDAFTESSNPPVDDIGEVFLDEAERSTSGIPLKEFPSYIAGNFYVDFNKNKVRDAPDGKYYGFGCKGTATVPCGSTATKEIGKQICILMSTSGAAITSPSGAITVGAGVNLTFIVSDAYSHALASGATVTLKQSNVTGFVVTSPPNLPYTYQDEGCGSGPISFTVKVTPVVPAAATMGGILQLEVITPGAGGATTDGPIITLQ
jgi:hypothetical protein